MKMTASSGITQQEKLMQKVSTEASRAVVAGFFRDLRAGDMDALRATFAPDATWTLRGSLPASWKWTGPEGIMDGLFAQIFGRLDPAAPVVQDVHRIIADGEYAVAEWTTHARTRDGRCYDSDYAGIFRVVMGAWQRLPSTSIPRMPGRCSSAANTTA